MSAKFWIKFVLGSLFIGALLLASNAACATALAEYTTLERAAVAALADAEALTADFEAGGTIYQCGTVFAYVAPVTQGRKFGVDVEVYSSAQCVLAGMYHTHPRGDAKFSREDVIGICARHTVGFIKPNNGVIRVFDCRNLSPGGVQAATHGEIRVSKLSEG